jgi:hypothetical protein
MAGLSGRPMWALRLLALFKSALRSSIACAKEGRGALLGVTAGGFCQFKGYRERSRFVSR